MMIVAAFVSAGGAIASKNFLHGFARLQPLKANSTPVATLGRNGGRVIGGLP
jgi:hypothetical protein